MKNRGFLTILVVLAALTSAMALSPAAAARFGVSSVSGYNINWAVQSGATEITVQAACNFCTGCYPNTETAPGCTPFEHIIPPYGYRGCLSGSPTGRFAAVRLKSSGGTILGMQKMICNQTNWPLGAVRTKDFIFPGLPLSAGQTVVVEADFYCSMCYHWYANPVSVVIMGSNTSVEYSGDTSALVGTTANVSATLKDQNGVPLAGKPITFTLDALPAVSAITNAAGYAATTLDIPGGMVGGIYGMTTRFAGDASYFPCSDLDNFEVISNRPPTITCPDPVTQPCDGLIPLNVHVEDADGDALTVEWYVNDVMEETDSVPAGGPPTQEDVTWTRNYVQGSYAVRAVVSDGRASAECTTSVTVADTTPSVISTTDSTLPAGADCTAPCPLVGTATDNCDPNPVVTQIPAAGTPLPLGSNTVTVTATDYAGNTSTATATMTVVDTTPPVITTANPTLSAGADCTAPCPAVGTATDNCDPNPVVTQIPAVGTPLPLGVTTVTVTATDAAGNASTALATVTVVDTTPPVITTANPTLSAGADCTAPCPAVGTATDNCDPNPVVTQIPAVGTPLPLGVTTVTVTATDAAGNASTAPATVTVVDTTPPVVVIQSPVDGQTYLNTQGPIPVLFSATDNCTVGSIVMKLDGNVFAGTEIPIADMAFGPHVFEVIATDASGNPGTGSATFVVAPKPLAFFDIKELKIDWRHDNGKPKADKIKVDGELDLPAGYTPAQLSQDVYVLIEIGSSDGTDMVLTGLNKNGKRWDYKRPKHALPDGFNMDIRKLRIDWNKKGNKPDKFKFSGELDHDVFNDGSGIVTVTLLLPVLSGGDLAGSEIVTCDIHKDNWEYHRK